MSSPYRKNLDGDNTRKFKTFWSLGDHDGTNKATNNRWVIETKRPLPVKTLLEISAEEVVK